MKNFKNWLKKAVVTAAFMFVVGGTSLTVHAESLDEVPSNDIVIEEEVVEEDEFVEEISNDEASNEVVEEVAPATDEALVTDEVLANEEVAPVIVDATDEEAALVTDEAPVSEEVVPVVEDADDGANEDVVPSDDMVFTLRTLAATETPDETVSDNEAVSDDEAVVPAEEDVVDETESDSDAYAASRVGTSQLGYYIVDNNVVFCDNEMLKNADKAGNAYSATDSVPCYDSVWVTIAEADEEDVLDSETIRVIAQLAIWSKKGDNQRDVVEWYYGADGLNIFDRMMGSIDTNGWEISYVGYSTGDGIYQNLVGGKAVRVQGDVEPEPTPEPQPQPEPVPQPEPEPVPTPGPVPGPEPVIEEEPEPQPVIVVPVPPVEENDDEPLPPVLTWEDDVPQTGDVDFGVFFAALMMVGAFGLIRNRRRI